VYSLCITIQIMFACWLRTLAGPDADICVRFKGKIFMGAVLWVHLGDVLTAGVIGWSSCSKDCNRWFLYGRDYIGRDSHNRRTNWLWTI
jgi:hypothetical protein